MSARELISNLFCSSINPLGEEILAGIAEAINPSIARMVAAEQPQFLPALFRAKPKLGISRELWMVAGDRRRELFESIIPHKDLGTSLVAGIVRALLESDSEFLLQRALEIWGEPVVAAALDWLAGRDGTLSDARSMH